MPAARCAPLPLAQVPPQRRVTTPGMSRTHGTRRLGIRRFSMANRNVGAQIVRLCAEFSREWLTVRARVARGLWGAVAAAGLASGWLA